MDNTSNILYNSFSDLPDVRKKGKTDHLLIEIIVLAICAIVSGCDNWVEIEIFCNGKLAWFRTFLNLENGIPSHDTFGRVFSLIDPLSFRECFIKWINNVSNITDGEIIAIDGKTVRRSFDKASKKSAIHMVSAWASNTGIVLGQTKVDEKTNEIKAIPVLLDSLVLKGCIVTIDAMGCQRDIANKIVYRPRNPEQSPFYKLVNEYFDEFERIYPEKYEKTHGFWRPIIRKTIDKFLKCGDLKEGFARVKCTQCGKELFVAYSCKTRCCCPACHSR
jgi:predicted transposase YbfD/YdcC